jgi:membrane dipeptidase
MKTILGSAEARAFHESLIVIDGHCDTVLDIAGASLVEGCEGPRDFFARGKSGHIDLPRLAEAGVTCQVMALFTENKHLAEATAWTWKLLETVEGAFARGDAFTPARCAADIRGAKKAGKVSGLLAIEGGEAIGGPELGLELLAAFHARGVRLMTLTWSRRNAIGRGVEVAGSDGLTDFGRRVVERMGELGMIVDASHLADESLLDLLEVARRPIVASHSNSRSLCAHPRNLSDDLAERIAATGGLVALTGPGDFIDTDPAKVTFDRFMEHVEHMIRIIGADHVGMGLDFDGWTETHGVALRDCTWIPAVTAALLERGYSRSDIAAVMGGNWLRVIEEVVG